MSEGFEVNYNEKVGQGEYAMVWSALPMSRTRTRWACKRYVAKVTTFDVQQEWPENQPRPLCYFSIYISNYFYRELFILSRLQGLGAVPTVYESWTKGEDGYLVIDRLVPRPLGGLNQWHIEDASRKLSEIHKRGVAHCDLHSGNVMFHPQTFEVVFIDFQLSLASFCGDSWDLIREGQETDRRRLGEVLIQFAAETCGIPIL